ncbi:MAG: class I SAM-dependent rRNA methyltransferase [Candidatus Doudnabacteria bacterium]|nr:class I SAM-dependent rRNA methyltransferase [Candidatus Doudnabacteria bacterium]
MYNATNSVVLKPGREVHARNRHPWVFLGAVASFPKFDNGDLLPVIDASGIFLGHGYFNQGRSIVGRMINFDTTNPQNALVAHLKNAVQLRAQTIPAETTAYRLVNGEGDFLPGLIVDVYGPVLVLQINTLGMEKLKPLILDTLHEVFPAAAIYEKSSTGTRIKEGLPEADAWLVGQLDMPVTIQENGVRFLVDVVAGQKTGFFLDQRDMRVLVKTYARQKTVLNCFAYTGGFSLHALAGGATRADSVDTDTRAGLLTRENLALNGFGSDRGAVMTEDVFRYLERMDNSTYDFIILDPPAFAKRASDVPNASRGYRELNRAALQKLPPGGLLLTSSCSAHIPRELFQKIVFQAAKDAKRNVQILSYHLLAADHPVNLYYPEGDYLKSLLLRIT